MQTKNRTLLIILIVAAVALCCCCILAVGTFLSFGLFSAGTQTTIEEPITVVTRIVTPAPLPTRSDGTAAPTARTTATADGATRQPAATAAATRPAVTPQASTPQAAVTAQPPASGETERQLAEAQVPIRDQRELALRLKPGVTDIPVVVNAKPPTHKVGDKLAFWVSNSDTDEHNQVTATLKYMNDVVYMWVDDTARLSDADLKKSADRFATQTYTKNREFFGSELKPGVDNDPRLHILHAKGMGKRIAGYYSSADEYLAAGQSLFERERDLLHLGRFQQRQAELHLLRRHVGARIPAHDPLGQ